MTATNFTTVILKPDTDMYLTQKEDVDILERVIATTVALGKNDSPDNWVEISKEKADTYKKEQEDAREEKAREEEKKLATNK